jgi:hypothetical protein
MTRRTATRLVVLLSLALASGLTLCGIAGEWTSGIAWPEPKVVEPGENNGPPADAIVLFGGEDMSAWEDAGAWKVGDGVVTSGGHDIKTKQPFGSCQLHVEFAEPAEVSGEGQGRGNSGVYLMSTYEIQVLDSYKNPTYFDGQCAAVYKQRPPLVNVCRKPGEWQTYDIIFEAPQFDPEGKVTKRAYVTVLQTACSCRTTPRSLARRPGTARPSTRPIPRSCRCCSSITTTRCGSATSGSASCNPMRKRIAATGLLILAICAGQARAR